MRYPQAKADYESRIAHQSGKYEGVRLENNTRLVKRERGGIECYAVKLHSTDVVTMFPNGLYMLQTGGWDTHTTKNRINKYHEGPRIVQSDWIWYLSGGPNYGGIRWSAAASEYDEHGRYQGHRSRPGPVFTRGGSILTATQEGLDIELETA